MSSLLALSAPWNWSSPWDVISAIVIGGLIAVAIIAYQEWEYEQDRRRRGE